jgi:hypothetical protein
MMIGEGISDTDTRMPKDAYEKSKDTSTFDVYLIAIIRDSEGRVIDIHKQRSHSPTFNFMYTVIPEQWYIQVYSQNKCAATYTNTSGTSACNDNVPNAYDHLPAYPNNNANDPMYLVMIQVGSGQQSNPYSSYSLAEPIANGSGAGQLIYGSPSVSSSITVSGNSAYFTISQTFNNNSGGTVTITEVGIITEYYFNNYNNSGPYNFGNMLVWYDVLSSAISVPNGGSVTIYYTFTVNP